MTGDRPFLQAAGQHPFRFTATVCFCCRWLDYALNFNQCQHLFIDRVKFAATCSMRLLYFLRLRLLTFTIISYLKINVNTYLLISFVIYLLSFMEGLALSVPL